MIAAKPHFPQNELSQPLSTQPQDPPAFKIAGMNVPPALMGPISKIQASGAFSMVSSMSSKIRPWTTDFASPAMFTKPGDDWAKRLQVNATYYKGNYSIIFFAFVLYSIIANPFLLMSILVLSGSWMFLLSARPRLEDGSLAPIALGGRVLSGMEQKAGLAGITVLMLLMTSLGSTIFWALGASMVFVGAHAVTHKTDFHQIDASEFGAPPAHNDRFAADVV